MNATVDKKVLERVRKLLALAGNEGATEAEAALAAERARAIMAEHGISNATIEASGGQGEVRAKDGRTGHVGKRWMREIMEALALQSFVTADWFPGYKSPSGKKPGRWELWGRESAVVTVKLMHEYLVRTVDRVARERGSATDEVFKEAMGDRIAERIQQRHYEAMREQKRSAKAQAGDTQNALVVVLEDYAQKEADLNNDLRRGLAPGTTAQGRREDEAKRLARTAERENQRHSLLSEGLAEAIVELIMAGFSRDRAFALHDEQQTPEYKEKKALEEQERRKSNEKWEQRWERDQEKARAKRNSPSYRAGVRAGDDVGLDAQVDQKEQRRLK